MNDPAHERSRAPAVRPLAAALVLATCACEGSGVERPGTVTRDSAGVAVVEVSPPYETWALSPSPVARIGVMEGDPDHQLSDVRHAARLSDGGIVVVDGGSSEVRWYDADGDLRARAGGAGQGPGELRRVVAAALSPSDTLVLYDARNQRLSWFAPDGSTFRDRRLALGSGSAISLHPLEGRLLIVEERATPNFGGAEFNPARDSLLLMLTAGGADAVDTVLRLPGREALTWVDYVDGKPVGTRQMAVPFGRSTLVGGTSDRIAVAARGRPDMAFFNPGGDLVRLARRSDVDPPEASESLRNAYVAHAVERARAAGAAEAQARSWAERRLEFLPDGRRIPAFDRLLTDAVAGRIWIRDFLPAWEADAAREWTVHELDGRVLARVTTAPGLRLTHVGPEHVVGVERDALGVEYVVVYLLSGSAATPRPSG